MDKSLSELIYLTGKTALVTGGAMGIGKAIAQRLHEAGANIVLMDVNREQLEESSAQLHAARPNSSYAVTADVSKYDEVRRAIDEAIGRFGAIDILVNNAGVFPVKLLADMSEDDFTRVIDINLKGVYLLTKMVSAHMKSRGQGGKIINITSIDALHPSMAGLAHYDASKHAVWGFTKNSAIELAEYKIWVNAIAPGGIATPGVAAMQDPSLAHNPEVMQKAQEAFLAKIPMHRMGDPDDIAKVALFLASDLATYITGTQIVVDGGALLK